jgi:hypothetical protein
VTVQNSIGAHHQWLAQEQYDFIVARMPILCVDLIPFADDGESRQIEGSSTGQSPKAARAGAWWAGGCCAMNRWRTPSGVTCVRR